MKQQDETISHRQADIVGEVLLAAPVASQRNVRERIENERAPKPVSLFRSILRVVGLAFGIRSS